VVGDRVAVVDPTGSAHHTGLVQQRLGHAGLAVAVVADQHDVPDAVSFHRHRVPPRVAPHASLHDTGAQRDRR
jgi:hypothetical protein